MNCLICNGEITSKRAKMYCSLSCRGKANAANAIRKKEYPTFESRFLDSFKLDPHTGCWNWTRSAPGFGYGKMCGGTRKNRISIMAHRFSYEYFKEKIPEGLRVCHRCDNPACVNPSHLFLGTAKDNTEDMVAKGRSLRGEKSPNAKLTKVAVAEIREKLKNGTIGRRLAEEYGVDPNTISKIRLNKRWIA